MEQLRTPPVGQAYHHLATRRWKEVLETWISLPAAMLPSRPPVSGSAGQRRGPRIVAAIVTSWGPIGNPVAPCMIRKGHRDKQPSGMSAMDVAPIAATDSLALSLLRQAASTSSNEQMVQLGCAVTKVDLVQGRCRAPSACCRCLTATAPSDVFYTAVPLSKTPPLSATCY